MANLNSLIFYLLIILITTVLSFLFEKISNRKLKTLICLAIILIPSFFAAIRVNIGTDFAIHETVFNDVLNNLPVEKRAEFGYVFLNKLVVFMHGNYHILLFLVSLVSFTFIFSTFYLMKEDISISFAMLSYMLLYYQMSFNYIRQLLAASIGIFACILYLKNKKYTIPIILCLIAASFHITALIYLPILLLFSYFASDKYKKSRSVSFIILTLLVFVYPIILMPVLNWFQNIIPPLRYFINYLAVEYKTIGFGLFRYLLLFIFPGFCFYNKFKENFKWIFNVMIIGFILWLTSYVTKMEFYRISHMYLLFIPLMNGYFWKNMISFSKNIPFIALNSWIYKYRSFLIKSALIILLFFFWYYDFFYLGAHETVPYQSILGSFNMFFMKGIF